MIFDLQRNKKRFQHIKQYLGQRQHSTTKILESTSFFHNNLKTDPITGNWVWISCLLKWKEQFLFFPNERNIRNGQCSTLMFFCLCKLISESLDELQTHISYCFCFFMYVQVDCSVFMHRHTQEKCIVIR